MHGCVIFPVENSFIEQSSILLIRLSGKNGKILILLNISDCINIIEGYGKFVSYFPASQCK